MKADIKIEFEDAGDAARFLAGYCSPPYQYPGLHQTYRAEYDLTAPSDIRRLVAKRAAEYLAQHFDVLPKEEEEA